MFLLPPSQRRTFCARLPHEEKVTGKRGQSLTLTVGASEATKEDGEKDTLAVGSKTARDNAILQKSRQIVARTAKKSGIDIQDVEESTSGSQVVDVLVEDADTPSTVLLCVSGCLNGISVIFLIDSGARECFVGKIFAGKRGLKLTKTKEKLTIHLDDGTVRVSNWIVKQGCVSMGNEHAEFLDFSIISLPTYDAISGKPWLDSWSSVIDWKKNSLQWRVGTRLVTVIGVQDPQ